MDFTCSSCGQILRSAAVGGTAVRCPTCKAVALVPSEPPQVPRAKAAAAADEPFRFDSGEGRGTVRDRDRDTIREADRPKDTGRAKVTCRHCGASVVPLTGSWPSTAGWIIFAALLVLGIMGAAGAIPSQFAGLIFLCWAGLLIRDRWHACPACKMRLQ
jgi:LSD1 subclass zinc finger protein